MPGLEICSPVVNVPLVVGALNLALLPQSTCCSLLPSLQIAAPCLLTRRYSCIQWDRQGGV